MTGARDTCGHELGLPTRADMSAPGVARYWPGCVPETGFSTRNSRQSDGPFLISSLRVCRLWLVLQRWADQFLLLRAGIECARAGMVLSIDVDLHDVFYLALEDSDRRMQSRAQELLDGDDIPPGFTYQLNIKPGKLIDTVAAWLEKYGNGIVLIDTLGRALERPGSGETTHDRDYRIVVALKSVADAYPGAAVVISHHSRKAASDDWLDSVSGTNAIAGGCDTIIVLNRQRSGAEGLLRITGRDVDEAEYGIILERPSGWRLDGDDLLEAAGSAVRRRESDGGTSRMPELVAFVEEADGLVDREMVAEALNMSPQQASVYLGRAHDKGQIRRVKRGRYGPVRKVSLRA